VNGSGTKKESISEQLLGVAFKRPGGQATMEQLLDILGNGSAIFIFPDRKNIIYTFIVLTK